MYFKIYSPFNSPPINGSEIEKEREKEDPCYIVSTNLAILSPVVTWEMGNIFNKLFEFAKDMSMLNI